MTKIDIVSGFLGAGKTTLIKKLLKESLSGEKVVLIENEFGEIGIDGGFLKDAGVEITEMNSGCICCSLVGDFGKALKQVLDQFAPDRILIEPSGVGKLSDVIKAVKDVDTDAEVKLDAFVTVADATKCKIYMKNFGEFFNNQIENASTIILSRTQKMKPEKLEECVKLLKEHNSDAKIITTPWDDITGKQILDVLEKENSLLEKLLEEERCRADKHEHCHTDEHDEHEHCHADEHEHCHTDGHGYHHHGEHNHDCDNHEHHHHHHADDVFESWGIETPHKFARDNINKVLKQLSESDEFGTILRAKGILEDVNGGWIYFDMVPGEYEVRDGKPDYTGRLCVIGSKLNTQKIEKLFI